MAKSKPKIGEGHASAMARQGLRELRGVFYPDSNVAQQPEYGLYGTKTPGEVADDRRSHERDRDEEPAHGRDDASTRDSVLGKTLRRVDSRAHESRDNDRDADEGRDIDRE